MPDRSLGLPVGSFQAEADQRRVASMDVSLLTHPRDVCLPQLVSSRAAAAPNALAVTHGKLSLTYEELEVRSNQVAHFLRALGVGPDSIVGLCMNRSLAMVVGALAILKAGGAYLPLDPTHPTERLAFLLKDAQVRILLTQQHIADELAVRPQNVVLLDPEGRSAVCEASEPVIAEVKAENLAYVIYTSGSTGVPKGVEITHGSLLNLLFWHQRAFGVKSTDRASQLASPGFDAAVWELWPSLTAGASVHLPNDAICSEPEALRNWLVRERITIAFVPTPLAERMIVLEWPIETALRILLTGADTLHAYPPATLPFVLVNNYGPTECTVVATSGPVSCSERPDSLPPIGRPISNVQVYILDERLQQVPAGVPGEIYIGGAGLARGYLNAPDLTAARFLPNPFSSEPKARLYKTGDLGRYLPQGQIAFLGRTDQQIKIRGYRIEPDEIVLAINRHSAVQGSCVVALEDSSSDKRLVAYVVPVQGSQLTHSGLRDLVRRQLPEYMTPSVFVCLEALPLTSNGKVDRNALPEPTATNTLRDELLVPPQTVLEERLAKILASLLVVEKVGVQDNFFLLGGHSLLAAQLVAHVNQTFGTELTLRSLFEAPTITALAAEVEQTLLLKATGKGEQQRVISAKKA